MSEENKSNLIISYSVIFTACTLGVVILAYLISLLGFLPVSENIAGMSLTIFFVALLSTVLPIAFLKGVSLLSRKVKKDSSHFDVSHIPDPEPKTHLF